MGSKPGRAPPLERLDKGSRSRLNHNPGQTPYPDDDDDDDDDVLKSVTLIVPRTKFTSRGDRAFCTAAPRLWNKLPVEIRRSQSVHAFKARLKTHLFDNYFNI